MVRNHTDWLNQRDTCFANASVPKSVFSITLDYDNTRTCRCNIIQTTGVKTNQATNLRSLQFTYHQALQRLCTQELIQRKHNLHHHLVHMLGTCKLFPEQGVHCIPFHRMSNCFRHLYQQYFARFPNSNWGNVKHQVNTYRSPHSPLQLAVSFVERDHK